MAKKPITQVKKTRLVTNKDYNTFRVDVIHLNDNIESFYFETKKEALSFQKFTHNLDKFKHFI